MKFLDDGVTFEGHEIFIIKEAVQRTSNVLVSFFEPEWEVKEVYWSAGQRYPRG